MTEFLEALGKNHKEWLQIAKNLGAKDYAEDIVQESYLKIIKYGKNKNVYSNGKFSKAYMYFTIRSVFINYIKQKNKVHKIQIEQFYKDKGFIEIPDQDIHKFTANNNIEKENAFWRLCEKMDKELNNWHWYDKSIYELYRDTDLSIRGLSSETKISAVNIFHTLKKGKDKIRDKFSEDYEDFKNGDYNQI
jgi:DNA-directed RNA polymerase specialized sigma24 family protein